MKSPGKSFTFRDRKRNATNNVQESLANRELLTAKQYLPLKPF